MENDLKMSEKWTKNANCERPYYCEHGVSSFIHTHSKSNPRSKVAGIKIMRGPSHNIFQLQTENPTFNISIN